MKSSLYFTLILRKACHFAWLSSSFITWSAGNTMAVDNKHCNLLLVTEWRLSLMWHRSGLNICSSSISRTDSAILESPFSLYPFSLMLQWIGIWPSKLWIEQNKLLLTVAALSCQLLGAYYPINSNLRAESLGNHSSEANTYSLAHSRSPWVHYLSHTELLRERND